MCQWDSANGDGGAWDCGHITYISCHESLGDSIFLTMPPYVAHLWEIGVEEDVTFPVPENFLRYWNVFCTWKEGEGKKNLRNNLEPQTSGENKFEI